MKSLVLFAVVAACLGAAGLGRAADAFLLYDQSTKIVSAPSAFWRSNLVDTSEFTWTISGGRVTPTIGSAIARDSEITAAIAALTSLYQPLDADLTTLAANNGSGLTNLNASTVFSTGTVPIARLGIGTPTGSKFLRDDGVLAVPAGGGGGDAYLANTQTFTGTNTFQADTIVSNLIVLGTLGVDIIEADSLVLGSPIGITALASNAAAARALLGVTYDVDVQSFSAHLHKIATNSWANGDLMLFNGSAFEALATTAAGRALLIAADAAAQRTALAVGELSLDAYGPGRNGETNKTPNWDAVYDAIAALPGGSNAIVSVTAPLSLVGGVLSIDTSGLGSGGGGGYDYLVTNVGGSLQTRAAGTNWTIISTTISSNHAPSSIGRFLEGQWAVVATNNSGTSATLFEDVYINGTLAFRDSYSYSSSTTPKSFAGHFWIVRESDTAATFVQLGGNANGAGAGAGFGDLGSSLVAVQALATNVPVNWSSNVTFAIYYSCDTSVSTNSALGVRVANAWLRAERAASEAGTGDVVGPASATDGVLALYDGTTGKLLKAGTLTESTVATDSEVTSAISGLSSTYQPIDADLTDLADGTLTGSKVGTGISGDNVTTGTVAEARIDTAIARLDSPGITGTPTVNGTNLMEAIASAGGGMPMLSDTNWTAKGQLVQGNGTSSATILAPGNIGDMLRYNGTNLVWVDDRTYWEISYEGGASTLHPDFSGFSGNGGSSPSAAYPGEAGHPGVIGGSTGSTTTNGYTGWATRNSAIIGGYGAHGASGWMKTPGVLPSSEPSLTLVGLHDQNSATAVVDGPGFFRLSTLGDFFQFVSRNNSSETTNPVVTSVTANTWYHWRVSVAHGGSNSVGWINGVAVGTNTSNIPTGSSRAYGVVLFMADDGGVTNNNQTLYIDSVRAGGFR